MIVVGGAYLVFIFVDSGTGGFILYCWWRFFLRPLSMLSASSFFVVIGEGSDSIHCWTVVALFLFVIYKAWSVNIVHVSM